MNLERTRKTQLCLQDGGGGFLASVQIMKTLLGPWVFDCLLQALGERA